METTSILVVIEGIYSYQFCSTYPKNCWILALFFCVFGISMKFPMLRKKWASQVKYFSSYWLRSMCLFKCITGLVSENPLAGNMLTTPKNSWNLHESTFVLSFIHYMLNWVRSSYFQSDLRFSDCLITRWLKTTSILVIMERIYRYQFKSNYLKKSRVFAIFVLHFWYLHEISNVLKKIWAS